MKKTFRINVVISYFDRVNPNMYRRPILGILTNLAWLYRLEYSISTNHDFNLEKGEADLFYFRSTTDTRIPKKEFKKLLTSLFLYGPCIFEGVDVFCQMYKTLPDFPFPSVYYKPLNYPYMEVHNGNKRSLSIWDEARKDLSDDDDDNVHLDSFSLPI